MRRIVLALFVASTLVTPLAAEECCSAKLAKTQKQIDGLLAQWQKASASIEELSPEERTKLGAELASVSKSCPIGSRVPATLKASGQALDALVAADKACHEKTGDEPCEFGDASVLVRVLPRVPVTMVVWGRDEEFEARASILFDGTAADQLPLDALLAAVNLAAQALLEGTADGN